MSCIPGYHGVSVIRGCTALISSWITAYQGERLEMLFRTTINQPGPGQYLEEAFSPPNTSSGSHASILPPLTDPLARANARLEADKVNRSIIPAFYRYLQAQVCL